MDRTYWGSRRSTSARRHKRRSGQALVEFALIFPVFLLIMLAIVDFGRAFYIQVAIQNGAREGARFGAIHPAWVDSAAQANPDNIDWRARSEPGTAVNTLSVTIRCTADGTTYSTSPSAGYTTCVRTSGNRVEVKDTTQFTAITPIIGNIIGSGGITLTGVTTMTIE